VIKYKDKLSSLQRAVSFLILKFKAQKLMKEQIYEENDNFSLSLIKEMEERICQLRNSILDKEQIIQKLEN